METAGVVLGLLICLGVVIALAGYVLESANEQAQASTAGRSAVGATVVTGGIPVILAVIALGAYGAKEMGLGSASASTHSPSGTHQAAPAPGGEALALMQAKGCLACHALGGKGSTAGPGPDLTHVGGHPQIAGVLPMSKENLVKWITNPPAVKPGTAMPPLPLSDQEREQIADFLLQQK